MNASGYIDVLVTWLQSVGATVNLYAYNLHYGGLYRSETREIFVNEPGAEAALMTLAHEAGHHIGYLLAGHDRNARRPSLHRERQAYVYGWRALRLIGADVIISRERWICECNASHRAFVEDQQLTGSMVALENRMERITTDPNVCGGQPCIRGIRIPVSLVLGYLAAGWTAKRIVDEFPELELEDIQACREYAARAFTGTSASAATEIGPSAKDAI